MLFRGSFCRLVNLLREQVYLTVEGVAIFVCGFGDTTIEQQVAVFPKTAARVGDACASLTVLPGQKSRGSRFLMASQPLTTPAGASADNNYVKGLDSSTPI